MYFIMHVCADVVGRLGVRRVRWSVAAAERCGCGADRRADAVRFPHGQGVRRTGRPSGHAFHRVQAQRRGQVPRDVREEARAPRTRSDRQLGTGLVQVADGPASGRRDGK